MDMIVKFKKLSQGTALLFIILSAIMFSGCGKKDAPPPGATMTIVKQGNVQTAGTGTSAVTFQTYRVTVTDDASIPLQGVKVNLQGDFTLGENIAFGNGLPYPTPAPVTLYYSDTTGDNGYFDFIVSSPTFTNHPLADVSGVGNSIATSGGTLLGGKIYTYSITAVDTQGKETDNAAATTIADLSSTSTNTNSITVTWSVVTGASGYYVYGDEGSGGVQGRISPLLTFGTGVAPTFPNPTPLSLGVPPIAGNNTGVALNPVAGTITAVSGPLTSSIGVGF